MCHRLGHPALPQIRVHRPGCRCRLGELARVVKCQYRGQITVHPRLQSPFPHLRYDVLVAPPLIRRHAPQRRSAHLPRSRELSVPRRRHDGHAPLR
eukprot:725562-Pleurochrysis_carterae.AAC.1